MAFRAFSSQAATTSCQVSQRYPYLGCSNFANPTSSHSFHEKGPVCPEADGPLPLVANSAAASVPGEGGLKRRLGERERERERLAAFAFFPML